MARQILHAHAEVEIAGDAGMAGVKAGLLKVAGEGVVFSAPLPVADKAGEARELIFRKA